MEEDTVGKPDLFDKRHTAPTRHRRAVGFQRVYYILV